MLSSRQELTLSGPRDDRFSIEDDSDSPREIPLLSESRALVVDYYGGLFIYTAIRLYGDSPNTRLR